MFETETEHRELGIEGEDVLVRRSQEEDAEYDLAIVSPDDGSVLHHVDFVLLEDAEFVNGTPPHIRGVVSGTETDAEVEWNLMVRLFGNDVCNVTFDSDSDEPFVIMDAVRTEDHGFDEGDVVDESLHASVMDDGIGAMFRGVSEDD